MTTRETLSDQELSEYVTSSGFMTESQMDTEADIPVPDRLLPKSEYSRLVGALKLSQKIGLLVWLNREGLLTLGGRERLLYLQAKASFEALEAGLRFARRLSREKKLQSDFQHQMRELNRRPQSKHFRQTEARRIGVGYRDKGTLPGNSVRARQKVQAESVISVYSLSEELIGFVKQHLPSALTEDGEWVDLGEFLRALGPWSLPEVTKLLHPL